MSVFSNVSKSKKTKNNSLINPALSGIYGHQFIMVDLKVGDVLEFVDEKHVFINGVKHKIVPKAYSLRTRTGIKSIPLFEFVKDR